MSDANIDPSKDQPADLNSLPDKEEAQSKGRANVAAQLLELVAEMPLFFTPDGDAFARITVGDHQETMLTKSRQFRQWLSARYYQKYRKVPGNQALQDARTAIEGKAIYEGKPAELHTRTAGREGCFYIDLTNDEWQVVEISSQCWRIIASA
jgi:hypothetical protein